MDGGNRGPGYARPRRGQEGAAAIEFSLMASVLLLVLAGMAGYGAIFWAQQTISYAAGEGARAVLHAGHEAGARAAAGCAAAREAAGWLPVGCEPAVQACQWDRAGDSDCVSITVTYDPAAWPLARLLRYVPGRDGQGVMPARLAAQATVQIESESVQ